MRPLDPPPHPLNPGDGPPPREPPRGDDYRIAPGALPAMPPLELRLRRIEPITFPADHFSKRQFDAPR
jgi:hypothetical protein